MDDRQWSIIEGRWVDDAQENIDDKHRDRWMDRSVDRGGWQTNKTLTHKWKTRPAVLESAKCTKHKETEFLIFLLVRMQRSNRPTCCWSWGEQARSYWTMWLVRVRFSAPPTPSSILPDIGVALVPEVSYDNIDGSLIYRKLYRCARDDWPGMPTTAFYTKM